MSTIHCTFRGSQYDYDFYEVFSSDRLTAIGIPENAEISSSSVSETNIKTALAQKFDVGIDEFRESVVEINKNGNITVRPFTFG